MRRDCNLLSILSLLRLLLLPLSLPLYSLHPLDVTLLFPLSSSFSSSLLGLKPLDLSSIAHARSPISLSLSFLRPESRIGLVSDLPPRQHGAHGILAYPPSRSLTLLSKQPSSIVCAPPFASPRRRAAAVTKLKPPSQIIRFSRWSEH